MYQKCHFEQNYTLMKVCPTGLISFVEYDRMYKFLFTPKNQEISTIPFKQTYAKTHILNIEVFHNILNFPQKSQEMQNTRLNNLSNAIASRLGQWFFNPWRRLSLLVISLLFGFFLGSAVSTTAGQSAEWDIVVAAILVLLVEMSNRIFYRGNGLAKRSLWIESLNMLKIGLIYSLFLEALKWGS